MGDTLMPLWMGPDRTPEEIAFQRWYADRANRAGIGLDPDDPRHEYDYRRAYEAGADIEYFPGRASLSDRLREGEYHWPSQFKGDLHPNRFIDGIDTRTGQPIQPMGFAEEIPSLSDLAPDGVDRPEAPPRPPPLPGEGNPFGIPLEDYEEFAPYPWERREPYPGDPPMRRLQPPGTEDEPLEPYIGPASPTNMVDAGSQLALEEEREALLAQLRQYLVV